MDLHSTVTLFTGRKMPVIGLGTWMLVDHTADTIREALKMGYPMIDTSGDYGTQPSIAVALEITGKNRQDIYIVTKVEEDEDAYESAKENLLELNIEYADLMLIHRPPRNGAGVELWEGLIQAQKDGLAKDIGVSNYPAVLIDELIDATEVVPVVDQIEWSPFGHSMETLDFAKDNGIVIQAYSPLTRAEKLDDEKLGKLALKYGKSPAQILLRWNLQLGTVPVVKANRKEHLWENLEIFDFEISSGDMGNLNRLNVRFSAMGNLPYHK